MIMNSVTYITVLLAVVTLSSSTIVRPVNRTGYFELLILHNNDMHARFEQTSQLSGACTVADREAGKCYGGFPRVAHVVKEARKAAATGRGPPVLYLNAGDTYTGTAWFTIYKWQIAAEFLNALQPDAVCLGNHEFDENVDGLIPFIHNLTSPVLAANLILDETPGLENENNLYNSIIITKNNVQIGIIGYLTPETKLLAPFNKVKYEDEIVALRREVEELKMKGVNIIIALGHSGYLKDMEIAREVEDIDLVIGGHSNTFLFNNNTTDEIPEVLQGSYPEVVEQATGRKVLVVQAYAYTKYLGRLHLTINSAGEIVGYDGEPILLNEIIPKDPEVLGLVNKYRDEINRINNKVVGSSLVFLDGEKCRIKECNMGNFITDAILDYTKDPDHYSEVSIAVVQGGRIRASIDRTAKPFDITKGDVTIVLPFTDALTILTMNGSVLIETLEHSVAGWRTVDSLGQFLQISGMEVTYDVNKPPGSRVVNVKAKCFNCTDPVFATIEDNLEYKLIMPVFLADGGDGYGLFERLPRNDLPYSEVTCVLDYLRKYSPINTGISNRITLLNEDKVKNVMNNERFATRPGRKLGSNAINNSLSKFCNILIFFFALSQCL